VTWLSHLSTRRIGLRCTGFYELYDRCFASPHGHPRDATSYARYRVNSTATVVSLRARRGIAPWTSQCRNAFRPFRSLERGIASYD
jgi:hypothetical protein